MQQQRELNPGKIMVRGREKGWNAFAVPALSQGADPWAAIEIFDARGRRL
jgi:hypothetical protein